MNVDDSGIDVVSRAHDLLISQTINHLSSHRVSVELWKLFGISMTCHMDMASIKS